MGIYCDYKLRVEGNESGCKELIKKLQNKKWRVEGSYFEMEKLEIGYEVNASTNYGYFGEIVGSLFLLSEEYSLKCEIHVECEIMETFEYYLINKGMQVSHIENLFLRCKDEIQLLDRLNEYEFISREDFEEHDGVYEYGNCYKDFVIGKRKEK